jgi:hypothetical protein
MDTILKTKHDLLLESKYEERRILRRELKEFTKRLWEYRTAGYYVIAEKKESYDNLYKVLRVLCKNTSEKIKKLDISIMRLEERNSYNLLYKALGEKAFLKFLKDNSMELPFSISELN